MKNPTFIFSLVTLTLLIFPFATPAAAAEQGGSVDVATTVKNYFANIPEMLEIARCESNLRQFTDAGKVLRGASGDTVGVFQFHETAHNSLAKNLGHDLTTLKGNLDYAKHLYDSEGTTPWRFSAYCWEQPAKEAREQLKNRASEITAQYQTVFKEVNVEAGDSAKVIELKNQINLLIKVLDLLLQQKTLTGR